MSEITELAAELWDSEQFETKKAVAVEIKKRLNSEQSVEQIRKKISRFLNKRGMEGAIGHANEMNIDFSAVDHGWIKTKEASFHFKNQDDTVSYDDVREDMLAELKEHAPVFEQIDRTPSDDPHMLFVGLTDVHLGAVGTVEEDGQDYNSNVAVQRCLEGVRGLIKKSQGFPIDSIKVLIGSDLFHAENATKKTVKGTGPFLLSEPWYKTFSLAKKLYIDVINMLVQVAPVECVYIPGNHGATTSLMLSETVAAYYHNHNDITFNIGPAHRKYIKYGNNLLLVSHGDGGKEANLPLTMAHEARDYWAECRHYYALLGHIHHRVSRDYQGVNVTYLRCVKSSDEWHSMHQYKHAPQAVEGFLHHPEHGRVATLHHIFTVDTDVTKK